MQADVLGFHYWHMEKIYEVKEGEHIRGSFLGISTDLTPERYYLRFSESGMEKKIALENKKNFLEAIKYAREKSEELKTKL